MQINRSRLVNALAISALYLIFLAWYDGWGMTALTSTEVDQYIANIREDSELYDLRDTLRTTGVEDDGSWEGFSISNSWFWFEWVGYTLPFGWAGAEAFVQYRQARRRMPLGLCDPLVCNRYLLWSLFGALQVSLSLILLPQYAEYETSNQFTQTWDTLYGAVEIVSLVMIWLVFFPPVFYRHWIDGAARAETAAEN